MVKERPVIPVRSQFLLWPLLLILLTVTLAPSTQAGTPDSREVIERIERLLQATLTTLPQSYRHRLKAALRIARKQTSLGQRHLHKAVKSKSEKKARRGKRAAKRAFRRGRNALRFYQRGLDRLVLRGDIGSAAAALLDQQATEILLRLDALIGNNAGNQIPMADAGVDQSVTAGDRVTLDGSRSVDADGDALTFAWNLTELPAGSTAYLDDPGAVMPSFLADAPGRYDAELIVNDGLDDSAPDAVAIQAEMGNTAPVADAGADQSVYVGDLATLDGRGSSDVDGDGLLFDWILRECPPGSGAILDDPSAVTPAFVVDRSGLYAAELIVSDGLADSAPDEVVVNTLNSRPVADAGADQYVYTDEVATLDAGGSSDVDGDVLAYHWALIARPEDSTATLGESQLVQSAFVPDLPGQYVAQLVVDDGVEASEADNVVIYVERPNAPPVADAGPDQRAYVGDRVSLDGGGSSDADGDGLNYRWSWTVRPEASGAVLSDPLTASPGFSVDRPRQYIAQLIVNDGVVDSAPDTVAVSTLNSPPVAAAGADQTVTVGENVLLDGGGSGDVDEDLLTYRWALIGQPEGSSALLSETDAPAPGFTVDEVGFFVVQLIVDDGQLDSAPDTLTVRAEPVEPLAIQIDAPAQDQATNQSTLSFTGRLNHKASLEVDDVPVTVADDLSFSQPVTLDEGGNAFNFTATNALGQSVSLIRYLMRDTQAPVSPDAGFIQIGAPDAEGLVSVSGEAASVEPDAQVSITNVRTGAFVAVLADGTGAFSARLAGQAGDAYALHVQDAAGNASTSIAMTSAGALPPDPDTQAPALAKTAVTPLHEAVAFLYNGADPIQRGVDLAAIEPLRSAVIRGRVLDRDDNPLPGVTLSVKDHPEFGHTLSRVDGRFDLVVNGGGPLVLDYRKAGYLPAQRRVDTPWQDYAQAEEVVLIPLDAQVTQIDLGDASRVTQVARGSPVTDAAGTRQATLLFRAGTQATLTLPDGGTQALTTLNVRATEYTVGENGPRAMPAPLPPTSGYTYAVELSVDEALALGATRVDFDQPVAVYVDNFLDFPTGELVPVGWYDYAQAAWRASDNGRVIAILAIVDGLAQLDIDGSGTAADPETLAALGIDAAEQARLATLYPAGKRLWRTPVTHFSPYDCNWPFGPPEDASYPNVPQPEVDRQPPLVCPVDGSIVEVPGQVLGERIPVTGTPFGLVYRSNRTAGYAASRRMRIALSNASIPASLKEIRLEIKVAGRRVRETFAPAPDLHYDFAWDGRDAYGRPVTGTVVAEVGIIHAFDLVYFSAGGSGRAFARAGATAGVGGQFTAIGERFDYEYGLSQRWDLPLGGVAAGHDLAGWSLDVHHAYDPVGRTLYRGDGGVRRGLTDVQTVIETVPSPDGVSYGQLAVAPDGTLFTTDSFAKRVYRKRPDQDWEYFRSYTNQGSYISGIAAGADSSLYLAFGGRIDRLHPDGGVETLAAPPLGTVYDLAVDQAGNAYIATGRWLGRIGPDGVLIKLAGEGDASEDGIPASRYNGWIGEVGTGPDGSVYFSYPTSGSDSLQRIHRITPDGLLQTHAGSGRRGFSGDGGPATEAKFSGAKALTFGPDNSLYFADLYNYVIRRVAPDGIINTLAGVPGAGGNSPDGTPALQAKIGPASLALAPDGRLYFISGGKVRYLDSALPTSGIGDITLAAEAGGELYQFDAGGRHLRTFDTLTGALRYRFEYNTQGYLTKIIDGDGNATEIEGPDGVGPSAIVGPDGQRTALLLDARGYLARVEHPDTTYHRLTHDVDGLLTAFETPRRLASVFDYDADGRLRTDTNAAGGGWTLARSGSATDYEVAMTSAEGRRHRYDVLEDTLGVFAQRRTRPDGSVTEWLTRPDLSETGTQADGTLIELERGPDPRFGTQAPVLTSARVTTPRGRLYALSTARSATLADSADPLSHTQLSEATTVNGRTTARTYDSTSRTWTTATPEGRLSHTGVDSQGRPLQIGVAGIHPLDLGYDSRGRLASLTQGEGAKTRATVLGYYPSGPMQGLLETLTDAAQRVTRFEYDPLGRVERQTLPDGREIGYAYDEDGNLTALTPPGRPAHIFHYDAANLEQDYVPPPVPGVSAPATHYRYNLDKQPIRVTRPDGLLVDLGYHSGTDQLERLTIPRGEYVYAYEPGSGQLAGITAPDGGGLGFDYDGFLLTDTTWSGTIAGQVHRTYTDNFEIASRSVNGAHTVSFGYDDDRLLTRAGALTLERAPANGQITGSTLGLVTSSRGHNGFGELEAYTAEFNATPLFEVSYTRDNLGRIKTREETLGGVTDNYVYDYNPAGQLSAVTKNGVVIASYLYDDNGNRTHVNGVEVGQYDAQDRLVSYAGSSYTYTSNGELESKSENGLTTAYQYDVLGNLIQVTLPGDTRIDYLIDGNNRRIGKQINGVLVQGFLYQDQLNPIAELDGAGQVIARFVYADKANVPAYMEKGGNTYRIISDHLGSPRLVVDVNDGTVVQRMDYDAWGEVTRDTNPGFQPFGFAGGIYDLHTGLERFGVRDYDPYSGRWAVKDLVRFNGGDTNFFLYVLNSPINLIDANGLWSVSVEAFAGIGGGVNVSYLGGTLEVTGRLGVGLGAGLSFSRDGQPSPHSEKCGSGYIARTTLDVSAGVGVGPFGLGGSVTAASGNAVTTPVGGDYLSVTDVTSIGNAEGVGFRLGASVGVDIGSYSNW